MPTPVQRVALIIAHPGHELLLHHWLECAHPAVFILTDGSGGSGVARVERSAQLVRAAGCSIGAVFGQHSDQFWYDRILRLDVSVFKDAADVIAASLRGGVDAIVTDSIEYFNPMHDLAAVVGHLVANRISSSQPRPTVLTYPIERPAEGAVALEIELDAQAMERKFGAARKYSEIQGEVERKIGQSYRGCFDVERLYHQFVAAAYPPVLNEPPYYEIFARQRVQEGRYAKIITYRDHMQPLVRGLLEALPQSR